MESLSPTNRRAARTMQMSVGSCVVDTAAREVRRDGGVVAVEPKVFDLLVLLLTNRDRVVTRDEIVEAIWSGRIVSEASLSTCIKAARRAVGDDGKSQRMIRTVQRRGFRAVAPVVPYDHPVPNVSMSPAAEVPSGPARETMEPPSDSATSPLKPPGELSVAVLPFEILSATEGAGIIADGLVQDIITGLGRGRQLFVIGRGTVFALRHEARNPRAVGRTLGVRYVLHGCLRHDGRRIRVNVSLMDETDPFEVWAETFDRDVDDIFALQDEIAGLVVSRVQAKIEDVERHRALLRPISGLDAWSAYYRACWHLDRHTQQDYDRAEEFLVHAARLDPGAARIYAGLSFVHRQRAFLNLGVDRESEIRRAVDLATHSLSLEPDDPRARWAFGRALMLRNDVEAALQEFELATSLNPSFAIGQYSVGFARSMSGRTAPSDDALATARRLSPIDPMRFAMLATHAFNCAISGRHARASDLAQLASVQPNAHVHIIAVAAACSALAGRRTSAEKHVARLRRVRPEYSSAEFFDAFPFQSPDHVAIFREGLAAAGLSG